MTPYRGSADIFNSYLTGKTAAKEKQTHMNLAHSQETLPPTAYSTHMFLDKRMLSLVQLLSTLEDGRSG
jgi:hypothetical protein